MRGKWNICDEVWPREGIEFDVGRGKEKADAEEEEKGGRGG